MTPEEVLTGGMIVSSSVWLKCVVVSPGATAGSAGTPSAQLRSSGLGPAEGVPEQALGGLQGLVAARRLRRDYRLSVRSLPDRVFLRSGEGEPVGVRDLHEFLRVPSSECGLLGHGFCLS